MAGKKIRIIDKKIAFFLKNVRKKFSPQKLILFGSRASGNEMNFSDWDFLIISDKFENISFRDRIDLVLELIKKPTGYDIEPLCYTKKEFNQRKKELGIVNQAVKTGKEIDF